MDKEPISLTYAIAESNPFQQKVPTKLSDLKPQIFVMGFLASKQTKKKKKKNTKTKAFRIKALEPPNQNIVNIKKVLEQSVNIVLKPGLDRTVRPG